MQTAADALPAILATVREWCAGEPLVDLCVLFGSMATGATHSRSDVDLAVWSAKQLDTAARLRWLSDIERRTGVETSLVIVTPLLDPVLGFEIVRTGRLLYERDEGRWEQELSRLWHNYNDSSPFRRAAREDLRQWAKEARHGT